MIREPEQKSGEKKSEEVLRRIGRLHQDETFVHNDKT
jgi:hypothetical protein